MQQSMNDPILAVLREDAEFGISKVDPRCRWLVATAPKFSHELIGLTAAGFGLNGIGTDVSRA